MTGGRGGRDDDAPQGDTGGVRDVGDPAATRRRGGDRRATPVVLVLVLAVAALAFLQLGGRGAADRLGILSRPERYTSLSFADPSSLPTSLPGGAPTSLRFTITNREGQTRTYDWSIVVRAAGGRTGAWTGPTGRATVGDGRQVTVAVALRPPAHLGPSTVEVRLHQPAVALTLHLQAA